jgi:hypothetical protein
MLLACSSRAEISPAEGSPPTSSGSVSAQPSSRLESPTPASPAVDASAPPPSPGATSYYSAAKLAEGPHGGAPLIALPGSIAIDYTVSGTCIFSVGLSTATTDTGLPKLTMSVTGPQIAGTWRLSIKPGRYTVGTGEAVGCVYSINVRDDR